MYEQQQDGKFAKAYSLYLWMLTVLYCPCVVDNKQSFCDYSQLACIRWCFPNMGIHSHHLVNTLKTVGKKNFDLL